ncbi:MAG: hypothetical protein M5R40_05310 [Anaerolineae bacterium]|nr:hypothetical protein [Anaerolineae bacterium]
MPIVAWFGSIDAMQPDMIRRLKDGIGLTAVIPDDYTPHHSGFRLPDDVLERGPIARWQDHPVRVERHRKTIGLGPNATPVFPGIAPPAYDDSKLLRLLDEAEKLGVEVWAHLGLWGYGGDIFPELALHDDQGNTIAEEYLYWGVPICPNNVAVRDWTAECLQYIARHYGFKAMDVDHGHFPPPASLASLFGCCCPRCAARARDLGYDFPAMVAALSDLRRRMSSLTLAHFKKAGGLAYNFFDFLSLLGHDTRLLDWFRFRSQVVAEHMAALTQAVHAAVGDACPVDSHLFPPAIAFLSGQDFPTWEGAVDRLTPGWGPVVGWVESQVNSFAVWARKLCAYVDGLDERTALTVIYRLFGYDQLPMPHTVAELVQDRMPVPGVPVAAILALEIEKAAARFSGAKPFLPPFRVQNLTLDELAQVGAVIKSVGAAGFVTGGNFSDDQLTAMRTAL